MNYKRKIKLKPYKKRDENFEEIDENRLIEMAWQDRMPFEVIYLQYGLTQNQVKKKLRSLISNQAYKRWSKRVNNRITKHNKKCEHKQIRFQGPY